MKHVIRLALVDMSGLWSTPQRHSEGLDELFASIDDATMAISWVGHSSLFVVSQRPQEPK